MDGRDEPELFDLCDRSGRLIGQTKLRAHVHRDGDWHRSLHIWVWTVGSTGKPSLLFQRRSPRKDTWPGAVDVAVTGHLQAGETHEDALREAEEEIGLRVTIHDVLALGVRIRSHAGASGHRDNEVQSIFATRRPVELDRLRIDGVEVTALLAIPFEAAGAMFRGDLAIAPIESSIAPVTGALAPPEEGVRLADFVPAADDYYRRAYESLVVVVEGRSPDPWGPIV